VCSTATHWTRSFRSTRAPGLYASLGVTEVPGKDKRLLFPVEPPDWLRPTRQPIQCEPGTFSSPLTEVTNALRDTSSSHGTRLARVQLCLELAEV
jgi:hypothetical protein